MNCTRVTPMISNYFFFLILSIFASCCIVCSSWRICLVFRSLLASLKWKQGTVGHSSQKVRKAGIMWPCLDTIHHLVGYTIGKRSTQVKDDILHRLNHILSGVVWRPNWISSLFSHACHTTPRNKHDVTWGRCHMRSLSHGSFRWCDWSLDHGSLS